MLRSVACLKIADELAQLCSSSKWELVSNDSEHSIIWMSTRPHSNTKTIRVSEGMHNLIYFSF